ncbi:hypothetical protein GQX74_008112 [Glossina fuscipes]|nr:hypothetical protein GQX74_008112 [Glossina fuscipes]
MDYPTINVLKQKEKCIINSTPIFNNLNLKWQECFLSGQILFASSYETYYIIPSCFNDDEHAFAKPLASLARSALHRLNRESIRGIHASERFHSQKRLLAQSPPKVLTNASSAAGAKGVASKLRRDDRSSRPYLVVFRQLSLSSSSSGKAVSWASCKSLSICNCQSLSILTSGGNNAGIATNSKFGSPTNFRANHRKGFSKL